MTPASSRRRSSAPWLPLRRSGPRTRRWQPPTTPSTDLSPTSTRAISSGRSASARASRPAWSASTRAWCPTPRRRSAGSSSPASAARAARRASRSTWRRSTWLWLFSLVLAPAAHATAWPAAGGGSSRSGSQPVEPGALPAPSAWSFGGETVRTPAIVTEGDDPDKQRVVYGTEDGRIHFRGLATGAQVGQPVQVVDSALTDPRVAFGPGVAFASGSGVVFAVHNDRAGIDIARLDARAGTR